MAEKILRLGDIALWIAIAIFLILLAWLVLGSSPTLEQLSLALAMVGLGLSWKGGGMLANIERNSFKQIELSEKILNTVERQ